MDGLTDIDEAMRAVLSDFSVDAEPDDILRVWTKIEPNPAMIDAVAELRRQGLQCCLASNQQTRRARWMREHLPYGQVFETQFYSCELGVAKPDPAYFAAIIERISADPDRVLFMDDNADNVEGARTAGLRAELFPANGGIEALQPILARHGLNR